MTRRSPCFSPRLAIASLTILLFCHLIIPPLASASPPFTYGKIDRIGSVGRYCTMAIDRSGRAHVLYSNWDNHMTWRYAREDGSGWTIEYLPVPSGTVQRMPSIAVDDGGNPHICISTDYPTRQILYLFKSGGAWVVEILASGYLGEMSASLALDPSGVPHICYPRQDLSQLIYASRTGGTWTAETALSVVAAVPSLAIDAQGNPHVAFHDATTTSLVYATRAGGAWTSMTLEMGDSGYFPSLKLDSAGDPCIVSSAEVGGMQTHYEVRKNGIWRMEPIEFAWPQYYTSLALDRQDRPWVAYCNYNGSYYYGLRLATLTNGRWDLSVPDSLGYIFSSVAVDPDGAPHLCYWNYDQHLWFADASVHIVEPSGGETWPVGSVQRVEWKGIGPVDLFLSTDGGAAYRLVQAGIEANSYALVVPNEPTHRARLKIVRTSEYYSSSVTDSLLSFAPGAPEQPTPFATETIASSLAAGAWCSLELTSGGKPCVSYRRPDGLGFASWSEGRWVPELVDPIPNLGDHTSLSLGIDGVPRISYWDGPRGWLRYASRMPGGWGVEAVDMSGTVGPYTSLVAGPDGVPHISYYDGATLDLKYAEKIGDTWHLATPDTAGSVGQFSSIALNNGGQPHIAYYDATNEALKHAYRSGTTWTTETVDTGGVGSWTSLIVDGSGDVMIAYADYQHGDLKLATKSNGAWTIESADAGGIHAACVSLSLDDSGNPRIAYRDETTLTLRYATKSDGWWTTEVVDSSGDTGAYASLALDAEGNPKIAYYDITRGLLRYADAGLRVLSPSGGTRWTIGRDEHIAWSGVGPVDIFLSTDGGSSYRILQTGVLTSPFTLTATGPASQTASVRITRQDPYASAASESFFTIQSGSGAAPPPFATESAIPGYGGGQWASLEVDPDGAPHVSYYAGQLMHAVRRHGVWTTESVDGYTESTGIGSSLALDPEGEPRIACQDAMYNVLRYAAATESGWSTETIDTGGTVGPYVSLVLADDGSPWVGYYDADNQDMRIAVKTGGTWALQWVDFSGDVGMYNSIALGTNQDIHAAYYDATHQALKYAHRAGPLMYVETVDVGGVGEWTSLALDAAGDPHISYYDSARGDLRYAHKRGGIWTIETIDAEGDVGTFTSIAVSADGTPCISYFDATNSDLKYATRAGGAWTAAVIDADGNTGWHTSLALDSNGNPLIAYYDTGRYQLRLADSGVRLTGPAGGEAWPVGGTREVRWGGVGPVRILLSVDGGATYEAIREGLTASPVSLLVPHEPTRFARLRIVRDRPFSLAESDSLFTINASVLLLSFRATPDADNGTGATLAWSTDPGPADLAGYKVEKSSNGAWSTLVDLTRTPSVRDESAHPGDRYRLFGINGLEEELLLGEAAIPLYALGLQTVRPNPTRGDAEIGFTAPSTGEPVSLRILDVSGRSVRTLIDGKAWAPGPHAMIWDGRDGQGSLIPAGVYFVRIECGTTHHSRRIVRTR
jgi:hypothetical protein